MIKNTQLLVIILCYNYASAQLTNKVPDSLAFKSFEYFNKQILVAKNDSLKRSLYAISWLKKAKAKNNFPQMAEAYKAMIYSSKKKERLSYADSMVLAAKKTNNKELVASAYVTKAITLYDRKEQVRALDNFLIADNYIVESDNKYLAYKIKFGIATGKYYLGSFNEAIALFKKCRDYYEEENDRAYLNTLHLLGLCYNKTGNYKLSSEINQLGIKKGIELENNAMASYFYHSQGINEFFLNHYPEAINKLEGALPAISQNKDFANESVAHFYIGKSYWSLGESEKAVRYFKMIDNAFQKYDHIRPDLREAYEILIEYYTVHKDINAQLVYINKLLKVDRHLHNNFRSLSQKIHKEYDTKKLLAAKRQIETTMYYNKVISISVILLMTVVIIFLIRRHFRNKKLFEELMQRQPNTVEMVAGIQCKATDLEINPVLIEEILKKLEKFEKKRKYLGKDMTLIKVAGLLNTNTKYISKIIYRHRGKKFIEYINDLKIDYIVQILKEENKYRNYTNKALGEEAGFGSTQNFTRAFNARTGISPTYFIQQLKKTQPVILVNQEL